MDMDDDEELYINIGLVIESDQSDLTDAITMKVMKDYTNKCDVMAKLKYCILCWSFYTPSTLVRKGENNFAELHSNRRHVSL